jgi:predicted flavoprotein YhiN
LLLEKTTRIGSKVLLTGQGRCNLTHTGEIEEFILKYNDGRFLYSVFNRFFRDDLLLLLAKYGQITKGDLDGRIFPVSDVAADVVGALKRYARVSGAILKTGITAEGVFVEDGQATGVLTQEGPFYAGAVILASGGTSYPATGSTGDGYRMAEALGHTIVPLRPALVPLRVKEIDLVKAMQGVSLCGARITAVRLPARNVMPTIMPERDFGRGISGKNSPAIIVESRTGDVIFTHFGLSGPVVLLISLAVVDALMLGPVSVAVDMRPGVNAEALRRELQRAFDHSGKRAFGNILEDLVPHKMAGVLARLAGVPAEKQGHEISAREREALVNTMRCLKFDVPAALSMANATVTAGGVSLDEIDQRTMGSKLVKNLYFCGEVMDIDGETGGYNLQAAFSTGWVAGESAAS